MPECSNCGSQVGESANFCPNCGEPQTEQARNKLDQVIEKQAEQMASSGSGSAESLSDREEMISRVAYALGFVFVVVGVSLLPDLSGVPIFLGGVLLFPPVRLLTARAFGSPLKIEAMAAVAAVFELIGAALFVFL